MTASAFAGGNMDAFGRRLVAAIALLAFTVSTTWACTTRSPQPGPATPSPAAWNAATWRPVQRVVVPRLSEADKIKLRKQQLAQAAAGLTTKPPSVALVRWTNPDEFVDVLADCLKESGWDVKVNPDRGLETPPDLDPSQQPAYELALYVCEAKYTRDPTYTQPYTSAQYGVKYDYNVQFVAPCLTAQGEKTPPTPTRESYIAAKGAGYDPYSIVMTSRSTERFYELLARCPRNVPYKLLYGET